MQLLLAALCLHAVSSPLSAQPAPWPSAAAPAPQKGAAKEAPAQVTAQMRAPLEQVAKQLAKGGRERETRELLELLVKLDYPATGQEKLARNCKDELARARTVLDALPAEAKQLRAAAKQLAGLLPRLEGEAQIELARTILLLDGECAPARAALGHQKLGLNWLSPDQQALRERRAEIFAAVQAATKLEIPLETGEVDDPLIRQACGVTASFARCGPFEVVANFSQAKTARVLRQALRARALSQHLRGAELHALASPPSHPQRFVLIDSREQYRKFAADCAAAGAMSKEEAALIDRLSGFNHTAGAFVAEAQFEAFVPASLLGWTVGLDLRGLPTPLVVGHLNWVSLACLGMLLQPYTYDASRNAGGDPGAKETVEQRREREEQRRLAHGGSAGSRSWLAFLAERGEDPPFLRSLVDQPGMITGDDLHKCTSMVEFLQEARLFLPAHEQLAANPAGSPADLYAKALGMPLDELEVRWRRWLIGERPGLAERIDDHDTEAWPPGALKVLAYVNRLRTAAFKGRVEGLKGLAFDAELSAQCALHAAYLALHPEQKRWPDAHEERAGEQGSTVEGAWAGANSLIAWGNAEDPLRAVEVWMGSCYRRLPLLDPGLRRIGWGQAGEFVVLDASSLAAPHDKEFVVVWPYDGMKDVPAAFAGDEFPDPVPGDAAGEVDEAGRFGYPITLQAHAVDQFGGPVEIKLQLFEGLKDRSAVPCHFSTPSEPTNPEFAPPRAWCLIPERVLKQKTEYTAVAEWVRGSKPGEAKAGGRLEWSFKTE